jgi:hypothetical protein
MRFDRGCRHADVQLHLDESDLILRGVDVGFFILSLSLFGATSDFFVPLNELETDWT